jgi:Tfp pilus assembly protein PilV
MKPTFAIIKTSQSRSGFTLIEVISGMAISITTVSLSANLFITANLYKVAAKKNVAMQQLVQADLEKVKSKARYLTKDDNKCVSKLPTGTAYTGANYATSLKDSLDTVVAAVRDSQANEKYVLTRTPLTPTSHDVLPLEYTLKRELSPGVVSAQSYYVYTEVIPDAALQCP